MTAPHPPVPPAPTQWTLWAALMLSLAGYGALPLAIEPAAHEAAAAGPALLLALVVAAGTTALLSIGLRRFALVQPARRGDFDPATPGGRARAFRISLLTWVLAESVGLFGLVTWFFYGEPACLYGFLAPAALLLIYHAPRRLAGANARSVTELAREDVKIG